MNQISGFYKHHHLWMVTQLGQAATRPQCSHSSASSLPQ